MSPEVLRHLNRVRARVPARLVRVALFRLAPPGACAICWRDLVGRAEFTERPLYACNRDGGECARLWHRLRRDEEVAHERAKRALLREVQSCAA